MESERHQSSALVCSSSIVFSNVKWCEWTLRALPADLNGSLDEAAGGVVDRLGDEAANSVQHSSRHNGVLKKTVDAVTAVAVGKVVQGDKNDPDKHFIHRAQRGLRGRRGRA